MTQVGLCSSVDRRPTTLATIGDRRKPPALLIMTTLLPAQMQMPSMPTQHCQMEQPVIFVSGLTHVRGGALPARA